jgi:hypothetical protein
VKTHLFCLTIDTDPDGLSGRTTDRGALGWESLLGIRSLPDTLGSAACLAGMCVPITWFVRIDGHLRSALGSSFYLLDRFSGLWEEARQRGHELGWHPHLYDCTRPGEVPGIISDSAMACDELRRLGDEMSAAAFFPRCFRNGEGWHTAATLTTIEEDRKSVV